LYEFLWRSGAQVAAVEELLLAIQTDVGGELLVVDTERIAHVPKQTRDGVGLMAMPRSPSARATLAVVRPPNAAIS
jgi:hypothetical protein